MQRSLLQIIHGYPSATEINHIWQYFEHRCAYCGCAIERHSRRGHLDHLLAVHDGGSHEMYNLVLACNICNGDEKREQDWRSFLAQKCSDLPSDIYHERYEKIIAWQAKSTIRVIDEKTRQQMAEIIAEAKQNFDASVAKMRALRDKIAD